MRCISFLLLGASSSLLSGSNTCGQPANEPLEKFVVTDGIVNAIAKNGNVLYLGGSFTQAGARTGGGVPVSVTTGQADTLFPSVNGSVYAAIGDGLGGWYIGGNFSVAGGFVRTNLAHIRSDRTVDPNWCPAASGGYVVALALAGSAVYAGGTFTNANGQARNNAAGFDSATGGLNHWNPNANGAVRSIIPYGTNVYLGGEYTFLDIWDDVLYANGSFFTLGGETTTTLGAFPLGLVGLPAIVPNSTRRLADGSMQFRVNALGVPQATVYFSTNLSFWQSLQTVPLYAGNGIFTDSQAPGRTLGFYRLSVP